jgi:hypothetical protein
MSQSKINSKKTKLTITTPLQPAAIIPSSPEVSEEKRGEGKRKLGLPSPNVLGSPAANRNFLSLIPDAKSNYGNDKTPKKANRGTSPTKSNGKELYKKDSENQIHSPILKKSIVDAIVSPKAISPRVNHANTKPKIDIPAKPVGVDEDTPEFITSAKPPSSPKSHKSARTGITNVCDIPENADM